MKEQIENIIADPLFLENTAWRRRHFQASEVVINEGEQGNALFFVEQGTLRVNVQIALQDSRSIQQGLSNLQPGDIFGEICLHGSYVRTASVIAITDATLLEINGVKMNAYLDEHPVLGYQFYKALFEIFIKRLTLANDRIESLFAWGLKAHGLDKHL
ncbi:MAG: cyclic nucleotide-binding domain-containing protein [Methylococcales bacterium]